jgi:SAM-dependent methyltransferase
LDAGCGTCEFLEDLRGIFGNKLELEGITLARPLTVKQLERLERNLKEKKALTENVKEHIERLKKLREEFERRVRKSNIKVRVGAVEIYDFGKKYDIIFSVGMIVHSNNPWQALENLLNHLKKGGKAYINFGKADVLRAPELRWNLERQGIEISKLSEDSYELKRLSDKPVKIT